MNKRARILAFYLPQFHPIPENDEWWGKGFTEWTNVGKAKPLYKGHYQPKVPADLGYYDLRLPEVREAQAEMAHNAGIEGFMYWHYWFGGGRRLLERPFQEVLYSGKPDFPFCLGWANHSWANKTWDSKDQYSVKKVLIEQRYDGEQDFIDHFNYVLPAFKDKRYIRFNNKPIFLIYSPLDFPEISQFIKLWNKLAIENGLDGIHFVGQSFWDKDVNKIQQLGVNAVCRVGIFDASDKIRGRLINKVLGKLRDKFKFTPLNKYEYSDIVNHLGNTSLDKKENVYPTVVSNFDHTPRSGRKGLIFEGCTPSLFKKMLRNAIASVGDKKREERIIFLRSWNEWAEGNYVEPDLTYGCGFLDAIREEVVEKM